mgnify:FL=1
MQLGPHATPLLQESAVAQAPHRIGGPVVKRGVPASGRTTTGGSAPAQLLAQGAGSRATEPPLPRAPTAASAAHLSARRTRRAEDTCSRTKGACRSQLCTTNLALGGRNGGRRVGQGGGIRFEELQACSGRELRQQGPVVRREPVRGTLGVSPEHRLGKRRRGRAPKRLNLLERDFNAWSRAMAPGSPAGASTAAHVVESALPFEGILQWTGQSAGTTGHRKTVGGYEAGAWLGGACR